jgi:hypothetical protein
MPTRSATIVHLLSGPRNVSTALMYSFAQRADTAVVDEPLYGHYLKLTHAPQPHWEEMLQLLETDADRVVRDVILAPPPGKAVWFIKNMAHHLLELSLDWLEDPRIVNVLLIRDPLQMLPSLAKQIATPTLRDAAYAEQARCFRELSDRGHPPLVLDSTDLLQAPPGILQALCHRAGLPFDHSMLHWKAGARPEDGPWAKYWYHNVHQSTGFVPFVEKTEPFPSTLQPLLSQCQPLYQFRHQHRIQAA